MDITTNILINVGQGIAVIAAAYILFRQKLAKLKASEADAEKSVSENYAQLLEEYRVRTKEEIGAMKSLYEGKMVDVQQEIIRLNKKIDDLQDEINAQQVISNKRQEQLNHALQDKEYYRGQLTESQRVIEKHLKKIA